MSSFLRINKKTLYVIMFLLSGILYSQETETNFWSQVRYGGGLGLNFSTGFFSATIAPSAIYEFNETLAMGIALNATFNNLRSRYKSTILGGSIIGLVNVIPEIQLSTELENIHVNRRYNVNTGIPEDNYWVPALFLGAGYRTGNVTLGIRYDVLFDDERSVYIDPWAPFVRFYF